MVTDEELEIWLEKIGKCDYCKKELKNRELNTKECNCPKCDYPHSCCNSCY